MKTSIQVKDGSGKLSRRKAPEWPAILDAVYDVSNAPLLRFVDLLLDDDYLLIDAARLSYRHQLGFFKIVLSTDVLGRCLRLHLWDAESVVNEDIHSHCADFSSRVILGRLTENLYKLSVGASYARFRYKFDAAQRCSMAVMEGLTGAVLRSSCVVNSGDVYSKRITDIHNVSDVDQGTLTVSAWDVRRAEACVLKENINSSSEDCSAPVGMSEDELRNVLCDIKKRIIGR